jgi:hypothetical protein
MTDSNGNSDRSWLHDNEDLFGAQQQQPTESADDDDDNSSSSSSRLLTFHCCDIYSKALEDKIKASSAVATATTTDKIKASAVVTATTTDAAVAPSSQQSSSPFLILVGIHTCGDLSRRVLELGRLCGADATIVSPCCCVRNVAMNKRRLGSFGYNTPSKARNFNGMVSVYQLWCWMLWGYAHQLSSSLSSQSQQREGEEEPSSSHQREEPRRRYRIDLTSEPLMKTDKNVWLTVIRNNSSSDC